MASRKEVVSIAKEYLGAKQGSKQHKKLVDTFNKVKPNGEVGNYTCPWCAIARTAWLILAGYTKSQVPMSYNCGTLITLAKKMGLWIEDDNYMPEEGDTIIYNWSDNGKGDCTTGADHTGVVVSASGTTIIVIEGNYSTQKNVSYRTIKRNQIFIRGFILLEKKKTSTTTKKTTSATKTTNVGKTYKIVEPLGLNIRKSASKSGKKLGAIPKGKKVKCLAESGVWIKITYGKITGWICTKEGKSIYAKVV